MSIESSESDHPASAIKPADQQSHVFQADVSRLLHLMVHSIYSDQTIFLRELISNASDACEKLRYEAISNPALTADDSKFNIFLIVDKDAGTLTIADNGIGMSHGELVTALGTIANSGTRTFLDSLGDKTPPKDGEEKELDGGSSDNTVDLIGQFGIGFYSAFMVADYVVVQSRRAGGNDAWSWSSNGKGRYNTAPLAIEAAPSRGTRVIIHLNDTSREYLEAWRLETIVREHSGAVSVPIHLREAPNSEAHQLTDGAALWSKPKSAISPAQYIDFYKSFTNQFDEPALTIHWHVEGRHEYTVLAFIPGSKPLDLFNPERKSKSKLYVRRVLITQDADLLPGWLRFVRIVVDSSDLPLNVSREMIQQSPIYAAIKRGVTNRILQELKNTAEGDSASFGKIWDNFGAVIKEGLYEEPERRDQLFNIARFTSSLNRNTKRTLQDYVKKLRPNQTSIYYLTGDDTKRMVASPQLEGFSARGVDVLLLSDAVDAFWVSTAVGFDGKPFKSVTQGIADINLIPLLKEFDDTELLDIEAPEVATFLAYMKQALNEVISDVRTTDRLSESPACLVATEFGPDRRLERFLSENGRSSEHSKPILEINPSHKLVAALARKLKTNDDSSLLEDAAWLLYEEARIVDGDPPTDIAAFSARLTRLLSRAAQ